MTNLQRNILLLGMAVLVSLNSQASGAKLGNLEYEENPELNASDLLPAEIINGTYHRVEQKVPVKDYMNQFTIVSDYGEFHAEGEELVKIRISEIEAINQLQKVSQTDAFISAAAKAAQSPFITAMAVAQNPVKTVTGIPSGAARYFNSAFRKSKRVSRSILEKKDDEKLTSEAALKKGADYIGISSAKREWAKKFNVDPYSENEVLQKELERVAWAAFAGGFTINIAVPSVPGMNYVGQVKEMVWDIPPLELEGLNEKKLEAMGIGIELSWELFNHQYISTTYQTAFVVLLENMEGVQDRKTMIELIIEAESLREVRFILKTIAILVGYHVTVAPFERLSIDGGRAIGITTENRLILAAAIDYGYWTKKAEKVFEQQEYTKYSNRELWISGQVSEKVKQKLDIYGWKLNENSLDTLDEIRTISQETR